MAYHYTVSWPVAIIVLLVAVAATLGVIFGSMYIGKLAGRKKKRSTVPLYGTPIRQPVQTNHAPQPFQQNYAIPHYAIPQQRQPAPPNMPQPGQMVPPNYVVPQGRTIQPDHTAPPNHAAPPAEGVVSRHYCPYCGIRLYNDAGFCANCGRNVEQITKS